MDRAKMEQAVQLFLDGVGERFKGDDLDRTPARVAQAWATDLLAGYGIDPVAEMSWTDAPDDTGPVLVRNIRFGSICVHHLLPFVGRAHVAYIPDRRLAGLSKIGRVVDALSRRMQIQEHLTAEILNVLQTTLEPRGALVLLEAEHTCMTLRGVRKEGSQLATMSSSGVLRDDVRQRQEILRILAPGSSGEPRVT